MDFVFSFNCHLFFPWFFSFSFFLSFLFFFLKNGNLGPQWQSDIIQQFDYPLVLTPGIKTLFFFYLFLFSLFSLFSLFFSFLSFSFLFLSFIDCVYIDSYVVPPILEDLTGDDVDEIVAVTEESRLLVCQKTKNKKQKQKQKQKTQKTKSKNIDQVNNF